MWSPEQYNRYRGERHRPFYDLCARIEARDVRSVVDLGCGDGALTATLGERWPAARVLGVDSSPEMIAAAEHAPPGSTAAKLARAGRLRFERADLATWTAPEPVDVLVANASLQWVDDHERLVPRLAGLVAEGGTLAFQVPGNYAAGPSHVLLREVQARPRWAERLAGLPARAWPVCDTERYVEQLAGLGFSVDAWETIYFHVLPGDDPVLEWTSGTALRPVLSVLDPAEAADFKAEYGALLRQAYPKRAFGTVFPFRRVFVVARRA
jgi:trans-aconitate 2-methyltransferase